LVTRFFAFLNKYEEYGTGPEGKVVKNFLLSYVRETNDTLQNAQDGAIATGMKAEWTAMLSFVRDHFPDGFKKRGRGKKVPRVRFEAIAVGVGLALRVSRQLRTDDIAKWLESEEFKNWTTSDASNNRVNLIGRVEFVRDQLLGQ
jgi:hypothetical protein